MSTDTLIGIAIGIAATLIATTELPPVRIVALVVLAIIVFIFALVKSPRWRTFRLWGKISSIVLIILLMCLLGFTIWPNEKLYTNPANIESLRAGQTIDYFKSELGPVYTTNLWYDVESQPLQTYTEYVFKGLITNNPSSTYYIQAVTQTGNDNVAFWSMTICDPNTTFTITDPASGKAVTLNQSTFGDVFTAADNTIGDAAFDDTLQYEPTGPSDNIYETEEDEAGADRLYIGVNNSCPNLIGMQTIFPSENSSGTFSPGPQKLEEVSSTPNLAAFRAGTKVNVIGMSDWNDESFYFFLQEKTSEGSMGYDFLGSPDGNE